MEQLPRLNVVDASGQEVMTDPIAQSFLRVMLGGIEPTPVGSLHDEVAALAKELAATVRVSPAGPFSEGITYVQRRLEHLLQECPPQDFPRIEDPS